MFVQTRSSLLKGENSVPFETCVFRKAKNDKPKENKETEGKSVGGTADITKKDDKLDMKKLRYEVIKFGTSGFKGLKKEESMAALAIALGAKPQKQKHRNYTEILAEKKANKSASKVKSDNLLKLVSAKGSAIRRRRNDKGSRNLLNGYGKIKKS